jgi:type IV pilus assembly protein PilB
VSTHVGDSGSIFDEEPTDAAPLPEPPGPEIDLMHIRIAEEVLNMLPTWLVRQFLVIPIRLEGELLVVALEEPANGKALTAVRDHTGREVRGVRADVESLVARYTMHYRA